MTALDTIESDFKARAGALTLLFLTSSADRDFLLRHLESALTGGALHEIGPDEWEDAFEELDDFDLEEDFEGAGTFEAALDPDTPTIGPDTLMQATSAGHELLFVGFSLERWLRNSPDGPLELGSVSAANATATLICCWSATVMHGLAAAPLALPELHERVRILSFETLEEHVEAMERTGQVEARGSGRGTRYAVTDWLREGIAPIAAAVRLECHHPPGDVLPPDRLDVEAGFQLALPLVKLPGELSGDCRLGVQIPGDEPLMAGAMARVERGRVVSRDTRLEESPEAWATGDPAQWLDTVVNPSAARLQSGGDTLLAGALLERLHEVLFGIPVLGDP